MEYHLIIHSTKSGELHPSSENYDDVLNIAYLPQGQLIVREYRFSSDSGRGYFTYNDAYTREINYTYKASNPGAYSSLPPFISSTIIGSTYVSSTAGGDPLEIFVNGFKSINSVSVGGTIATIAKFDAASNELFIIPPPKSPTPSSSDYAVITVTGESKSLAEPGVITLSYRGLEYRNECPKNYFEIPANTGLGTSKFCVMTFEAKDLNGKTYSSHQGNPIVNIPRDGTNGAIVRCNSISQYHSLISNIQWQVIAHSIASDSYNQWDYDALGTAIPIGHSDNNPSSPQAASAISGQGAECINTGNNDLFTNLTRLPPPDGICDLDRSAEPQARYFDRDRTNLWDIAGNAAEWVADDYTHTGISNLDNYASQFAPGSNIFAPLEDYTSYESGLYGGLGYLKVNAPEATYGIARGGSYMDGDKSGVFAADATLDPTQGYPNVGFRCVVVPPATVP